MGGVEELIVGQKEKGYSELNCITSWLLQRHLLWVVGEMLAHDLVLVKLDLIQKLQRMDCKMIEVITSSGFC